MICANPKCGKEFFKKTKRMKFCSCQCAQVYHKSIPHESKICEFCGNAFIQKLRSQKNCSVECSAAMNAVRSSLKSYNMEYTAVVPNEIIKLKATHLKTKRKIYETDRKTKTKSVRTSSQ